MESNLIFIKGSVPGSKNSMVLIQKVAKKINRSTTQDTINKMRTSVVANETKKTKKKPEVKKTGKWLWKCKQLILMVKKQKI